MRSLTFLLALLATTAAWASKPNLAYVYFGPGSCEQETQADGSIRNEECSTMAAKLADQAGLHSVAIRPGALTERSTPQEIAHFFDHVAVWIQPGGTSSTAFEALGPVFTKALKTYIRNGGGYVGWCAGGFMAMPYQDSDGDVNATSDLGIFPGVARAYKSLEKDKHYYHEELTTENGEQTVWYRSSSEKVSWSKQKRRIYFAGGPNFVLMTKAQLAQHKEYSRVEIVSRYQNGQIAAAHSQYGKGRVFIAGMHPEAPDWWFKEDKLEDTDGRDWDIAIKMIKWSARLSDRF